MIRYLCVDYIVVNVNYIILFVCSSLVEHQKKSKEVINGCAVCVSCQLDGIFGKQTWNLSVSFNHTKT